VSSNNVFTSEEVKQLRAFAARKKGRHFLRSIVRYYELPLPSRDAFFDRELVALYNEYDNLGLTNKAVRLTVLIREKSQAHSPEIVLRSLNKAIEGGKKVARS